MRLPSATRLAAVLGPILVLTTSGGVATAASPRHLRGTWDVKVVAAHQIVTVNGNPMTVTEPDDITKLGRDIFVAYQNGVGPQGQPAADGIGFSTVVEYRLGGTPVAAWNVAGHADGLTADPVTRHVIATVNEDASSSLYTIDPDTRPIDQVVHYNYSPANPLPHGGGTDAISIYRGQILVSASAPGTVQAAGTTPAAMPAVYRATLSRQPGTDTGTAALTPLFYDSSPATVANTSPPMYSPTSPSPSSYGKAPAPGTKVALALTDPDSNEVVPSSSPRFAGDFVLDSQGDEQLVFTDGTPAPHLWVLDLSQSINDSAYITDRSGTGYVTDPSADEVLAVRGPFRPGEVLVAATPGDADNPAHVPNFVVPNFVVPNFVATLDLSNGTVAPVPGLGRIRPEGLVYVNRPR